MQNKDIDTDKPGRVFDSFGEGRHSMSPKQEPTKHIAQQFALDLAELLNGGRLTHAYDKLILVAEPKFLGILRAALDKNTESLVIQTVNNDPCTQNQNLSAPLNNHASHGLCDRPLRENTLAAA